jgi:hypothetical protein
VAEDGIEPGREKAMGFVQVGRDSDRRSLLPVADGQFVRREGQPLRDGVGRAAGEDAPDGISEELRVETLVLLHE